MDMRTEYASIESAVCNREIPCCHQCTSSMFNSPIRLLGRGIFRTKINTVYSCNIITDYWCFATQSSLPSSIDYSVRTSHPRVVFHQPHSRKRQKACALAGVPPGRRRKKKAKRRISSRQGIVDEEVEVQVRVQVVMESFLDCLCNISLFRSICGKKSISTCN